MINVNDFKGKTDSDIIENAIANLDSERVLVIPPRASNVEAWRTYWLIDRAILVPENTTIILRNCKIKLSDNCRDNFFRSANCGMGIDYPDRISNICIVGEGLCVLEGAERPRATGDGSKLLHNPCPHLPEDVINVADWIPEERRTLEKLEFMDIHAYSYGTDADKENESHYGDWRGIGILFANVDNFTVSNLKIAGAHGWGISLEACAHGKIEKIDFDAHMCKEIDSMLMNIENQDGIDIRNGCHDITVSDITGVTGDDVIALTAIANDKQSFIPGGSLGTTHVMHNDWTKRDKNIHDIIINNIKAKSTLCMVIRLLACNTEIYNVVINNVIDTFEKDKSHYGTILIGEADGVYGKNLPGGIKNVLISNVICNSERAVIIPGYLKDSSITNVINTNNSCIAVEIERPDGIENVLISGVVKNSSL